MSKRYARFLTAVLGLFLGGRMVWQLLLTGRAPGPGPATRMPACPPIVCPNP